MTKTLAIAAAYLIAINWMTYFAFWNDKERAHHQLYRIPENTLLLLAVLGGSPAALFARQHLRHKTRKQPFSTYLLSAAGIQIGVGVLLFLLFA